ncbi:MAG: tandem-95 repeat protein, partial [Amphritea sp.]|nr:tandem-95 repeat protein [Amphritea sp.]
MEVYDSDTDDDGLDDAWEITHFGDLVSQNGSADADGDGLTNAEELAAGTNPSLVDSDGDGLTDLEEIDAGTDPTTYSNFPPVVADITIGVAENAALGTTVTTVNANDPNVTDTLSYTIISGNTGGAFAIDNNGELSVAAALDHETIGSYTLTVEVTDSGSPAMSETASVIIDVNPTVLMGLVDAVTVAAAEPAEPGATTGTYVIRERESDDDPTKHISAFFKHDLSSVISFNPAAGDTATVSLLLQGRLNTTQDGVLSVAQVTGDVWDSTVSLPQHNWATVSGAPVGPGSQLRQGTLVANVRTATLNTYYTLDITDIVDAWVNGEEPNHGLCFYLSNNFQGAGFDEVTLALNVPADSLASAPVANDATFAITENSLVGTVVGSVTATDANPDDILSYAITAGNAGGEFAIDSATGEITTTATIDFETASQYVLTVEVSDGNLTDTATVTVNVTDVNEAPVAADDSTVVDEEGSVAVTVLANDADVDSSISVASVTQGTNGTVSTNGTTVTYVPAADFSGVDSFTYTITDGELTDTATVSVTVNAVNDAPVAANDSAVVNEDGSVAVTVLTNDSDIDSSISVASVTQGTNGTASTNGTTVTYMPTADFSGVDSFTYTITDGELTDTATVSVTVSAVNDAPIATDDSTVVDEDGSVVV